MLTDDEFEMLHIALVRLRDEAFLATGDKNDEYVKQWEKLIERVDALRIDAYFDRRAAD